MRSDARGYPWWPGAVCSTQGPDTEAQDQSLPLSRFSLQRTAGPYSWVRLEEVRPESVGPLLFHQRSDDRPMRSAAQGHNRKWPALFDNVVRAGRASLATPWSDSIATLQSERHWLHAAHAPGIYRRPHRRDFGEPARRALRNGCDRRRNDEDDGSR